MRALDMPDALPDGSKLLHIGMPKTGTTALQTAVHEARPALEEHGAHNVSTFARHELKVALRAAGTLPAYEGSKGSRRWPELAADFRASTARVTFWSSEALSQAKPDRIRYLADELGPDLHILVTLRPMAPLLVSQWQETLRRRGVEPLEAWLRKTFDAVRPDGEVAVDWERVMPTMHRFSPPRVLREWGEVFGEDRIIFQVADPVDRQHGLRVFEALLGVPELLAQPALDNASLPWPEAEMLRSFNLAYTERGGDHATWMHTMGTLARTGLRELTTRTTPHPIRAPRWAAERSNAYADVWIEGIRASGAAVVGDLEHLRVDPDDFPESLVTPTEVSVETAGLLMDVGVAACLEWGAEEQEKALRRAGRQRSLEGHTAAELAAELRRRVKARLRRRGK